MINDRCRVFIKSLGTEGIVISNERLRGSRWDVCRVSVFGLTVTTLVSDLVELMQSRIVDRETSGEVGRLYTVSERGATRHFKIFS